MQKTTSPSYSQIVEEAAEWFIELEGDTASLPTRQAFDEWLRRSPEHVRAFLELLKIWEGAAATPPAETDAEAVIAHFFDARSNVVTLEVVEPEARDRTVETRQVTIAGPQQPTRRRTKRTARLFVAAASIAAATLSVLLYTQRSTYTTETAEQRSIVLDDGSSVVLNTRSRIRVRYSDDERTVELLAGQALFHVAKDPSRPFVVRSGDVRVRAVGTRFDVYRKATGTTVTVVEGTIAVSGEEALRANGNPDVDDAHRAALDLAPDEILLSAGEQVSLTPAAIPTPNRANTAAATAWTQRQLQFQRTALGTVVEEFNRYNERQLRIEDPRIDAFLVSGTFSSTDPQALLRFLGTQPGIRVVEAGDEIRIEPAESRMEP